MRQMLAGQGFGSFEASALNDAARVRGFPHVEFQSFYTVYIEALNLISKYRIYIYIFIIEHR